MMPNGIPMNEMQPLDKKDAAIKNKCRDNKKFLL